MKRIPRLKSPDSTLFWRADPYRYISRQCNRLGADLFACRLLLEPHICMHGKAAARLFYDENLLRRRGAAPQLVQKTLFGRGGVQTLDDDLHKHRRSIFLTLTQQTDVQAISQIHHRQWLRCIERLPRQQRVSFFDVALEVLTRTVCQWAGVPLTEEQIPERTRQLTFLFDGAGAVGLRHLSARKKRSEAEQWAGQLITATRKEALQPPENSALAVIAHHRDLQNLPLGERQAAVELLNILRPTVAVAVYHVFIVLALHTQPQCPQWVINGGDAEQNAFVQEVRRIFPFFPVLVALTRKNFEWQGYCFPSDHKVMLDLYGTNHDPRIWPEPMQFQPERFLHRTPDEYELIPQGGGERQTAHRCPGEPLTIELMKSMLRILLYDLNYDVPDQNLALDYRRLPALPHSRMVIRLT